MPIKKNPHKPRRIIVDGVTGQTLSYEKPEDPKPQNPLRIVRKATGYTQGGFAKKVGASLATIQSIEQKRRKINHQLVMRVSAFAGAKRESLKAKEGIPLDLFGDPYNENSFIVWKKLSEHNVFLKHELNRLQGILAYVGILLYAAHDQNKWYSVIAELDHWLSEMTKNYNLQSTAERILKEHRGKDKKWPPVFMEHFVGRVFLEQGQWGHEQ